ncbi:FliH/SctL family protein [Demequina capsici]|uniref:FliH/SctL family protein n=1 Tax=Demequina capsici TaxID=3075620 RepID=A0AA96JAG2_9MICO|nr:FliH/SctL family protein [Demequina sp. PMTSA13]WNM27405.1 FliH/SctL family protein [Demequina sp. PMTSA13]
MSPDARVSAFVPVDLGARRPTDEPATEASGQPVGHAAGYAAGFAAGTRAAAESAATDRARQAAEHDRRELNRDASMRRALGALAEAITQWEQRSAPVLDSAERALHAAAFELAEAILGSEIEPGPRSARTILHRALSVPDDVTPTRVRLHPSDLEHAQRLIDSGDADLPDTVMLMADPHLSPGDAITEYEDGVLDARIGTALERARAALLEEEQS